MQSVEFIIDDLYKSNFAESNVDLQIDILGALNYTTGIKLRMSLVDSFEDEDVEEWKAIAHQRNASDIRTRVNTSSGNIDLNIEYKSKRAPKLQKIWMVRTLLLLVASWSYQQLHHLQSDRYPSVIELFG
jgi:hypothetical protein